LVFVFKKEIDMYHSGAMKWVGKAAWLFTGIAALVVGLVALGIDVYNWDFFAMRPGLVMALRYIMLVSGIVSLAMFAMACTSEGCVCSCGNSSKM
jgi:hypothetical protein